MRIKRLLSELVRHEIFVPALIGILLRLTLMPFFIWPHDIVSHYYSIMYIINAYDPYSVAVSMYPPLIYLILYPLLIVAHQLGIKLAFDVFPETFEAAAATQLVTSMYSSPSFFVLWKIPLLVFDTLLGILIYKFAEKITLDSSRAKKAFILWFFNPFVLMVSYVHGAFDVICAFFIFLGIYLLIDEKYFLSGISFGFGGLTKISPFLIAIPIIVAVFMRHRKDSWRKALSVSANFLAGCAVPVIICLPWFINYFHMLNAVTLKEISINGGLNQWFFAANRDFRRIINSRMDVLTKIFYFYPLISLIPILIYSKKIMKTHEFSYTVLMISAISLEIVYLVSPLTIQPQYTLWIIPILTTLYARKKAFYFPAAVLSLAATAFFFSIQSPFAFMYPLALFTPLVKVDDLNMLIVDYAAKPGRFCLYLREDLCLIFGALAFFTHILLLIITVKELSKDG